MNIPNPLSCTWPQWSAYLGEVLADLPDSIPENDWRQFADRLCGLSEFSSLDIPTQLNFQDWRSWASRVVGVLS